MSHTAQLIRNVIYKKLAASNGKRAVTVSLKYSYKPKFSSCYLLPTTGAICGLFVHSVGLRTISISH